MDDPPSKPERGDPRDARRPRDAGRRRFVPDPADRAALEARTLLSAVPAAMIAARATPPAVAEARASAETTATPAVDSRIVVFDGARPREARLLAVARLTDSAKAAGLPTPDTTPATAAVAARAASGNPDTTIPSRVGNTHGRVNAAANPDGGTGLVMGVPLSVRRLTRVDRVPAILRSLSPEIPLPADALSNIQAALVNISESLTYRPSTAVSQFNQQLRGVLANESITPESLRTLDRAFARVLSDAGADNPVTAALQTNMLELARAVADGTSESASIVANQYALVAQVALATGHRLQPRDWTALANSLAGALGALQSGFLAAPPPRAAGGLGGGPPIR